MHIRAGRRCIDACLLAVFNAALCGAKEHWATLATLAAALGGYTLGGGPGACSAVGPTLRGQW